MENYKTLDYGDKRQKIPE